MIFKNIDGSRETIKFVCPNCKTESHIPKNSIQVFCVRCKQWYKIMKKGETQ